MRRSASRNKYGNKKTTAGGVTFDSKAEAMYYLGLLADLRKGIISNIELQPRFELQPKFEKDGVNYRSIEYVADFRVTYPSGQIKIIDVKGKETEMFKMKKKMFDYKYPNLLLILEKV